MEKNDFEMNEVDKIASLAAQIEVAEKDADIVTDPTEYKWYTDKYIKSLYDELYINFQKLTDKLIHTKNQTDFRYQIQLPLR